MIQKTVKAFDSGNDKVTEFYIDNTNGSLFIVSNSEVTEIDFDNACELVHILKNELSNYIEKKDMENAGFFKKIFGV